MKVMKFGGSSVGNAEAISMVIDLITRAAREQHCAVVLSAMQGTTDALIEAGRAAERGDEGYVQAVRDIHERHASAITELFSGAAPDDLIDLLNRTVEELLSLCKGVRLIGELSPRTLDRILSFGEIMSTRIVSWRLLQSGVVTHRWADSRDLIRTNSEHGFAAVEMDETYRRIRAHFERSDARLTIVPGFIASDADGHTTTLGRGGSDYTAALIAAAMGANILEIWTDVSGMMSADPRFVRNVRQISLISYREAMELSHFGAKVIYPPTLQPVMAKGIPVVIKNTFVPNDPGTRIEASAPSGRDIIRGISSIDGIAVLNLEGSGMVGIPGFSRRLFDALSRARINVVLITQSSSEHSICVAVEERASRLAKQAVDAEFESEIARGRIEPLKVDNGFAILALVGDNMKEHTGVSGKMFTTLGHNGINIHAIAQGSSERNISAIISATDVRKAVNTLHEEFFSDGKKQVNVFIAGVGTVGSRLLQQLRLQQDHLSQELRLNLRVVGVANSKGASIDTDGVDLASTEATVFEPMDVDSFTDRIIAENLRNSIFVDVTASAAVVNTYDKLLERSISVIACNKIAASSEYQRYERLKTLAREFGSNFYFETNVGAGLPVINTLNDLTRSGDRVHRIDAVLSGTLNFVFNNYDGSRSFAAVVRDAQEQGYTEPDPRLDLSGVDVARKILILAREAGHRLEMSDVQVESFLPASCLGGSVEDLYTEMERHEDHFRRMLDEAFARGEKLKYIASFTDGKASAGLRTIEADHDFANLSGKDNAVLFYTSRYHDQPLVVKGAGAGADVTAAGVFADIIRASRT